MKEDGSCHRLGVIALEDIEEGESVFKIPKNVLLEPHTSAISGVVLEFAESLPEIDARYCQVCQRTIFANDPGYVFRMDIEKVEKLNRATVEANFHPFKKPIRQSNLLKCCHRFFEQLLFLTEKRVNKWLCDLATTG